MSMIRLLSKLSRSKSKRAAKSKAGLFPAYTLPDKQITITDKGIHFDLTHRPEETRSFIDGTVVSAMGLEAAGHTADFNQPVYFINYCTIQDEVLEEKYRTAIKPHLQRVQAGFVFSNIEDKTKASHLKIPEEQPAPKVPWVHNHLELVRFPNPQDWADMATHPDLFKIYHYKFLGAGDNFNIAVQESIFDPPNPSGINFKPGITGPAILHNFNLVKDKFEPLLAPLGEELLEYNLGRLAYAGRTIARPYSILKNGKQLTQKAWMEGSIIISLNGSYDTDKILNLESYSRFIKETNNNAVTLFA